MGQSTLVTKGGGTPVQYAQVPLTPYLAQGGEGRHVRWFEGQDLDVNGDYVSSER